MHAEVAVRHGRDQRGVGKVGGSGAAAQRDIERIGTRHENLDVVRRPQMVVEQAGRGRSNVGVVARTGVVGTGVECVAVPGHVDVVGTARRVTTMNVLFCVMVFLPVQLLSIHFALLIGHIKKGGAGTAPPDSKGRPDSVEPSVPLHFRPYLLLRRATPTRPSRPEPSSQAAAGTGTAVGVTTILVRLVMSKLALKPWNGPSAIGLPPTP